MFPLKAGIVISPTIRAAARAQALLHIVPAARIAIARWTHCNYTAEFLQKLPCNWSRFSRITDDQDLAPLCTPFSVANLQ